MKPLALILLPLATATLLLLVLPANGLSQVRKSYVAQYLDSKINGMVRDVDSLWSSRWNTAVLNDGDSTCAHKWVDKPHVPQLIGGRCGVLHDSRGCPSDWGYRERICEKCLRKECDREDRYYSDENVREQKQKSDAVKRYEELEKKIGK